MNVYKKEIMKYSQVFSKTDIIKALCIHPVTGAYVPTVTNTIDDMDMSFYGCNNITSFISSFESALTKPESKFITYSFKTNNFCEVNIHSAMVDRGYVMKPYINLMDDGITKPNIRRVLRNYKTLMNMFKSILDRFKITDIDSVTKLISHAENIPNVYGIDICTVDIDAIDVDEYWIDEPVFDIRLLMNICKFYGLPRIEYLISCDLSKVLSVLEDIMIYHISTRIAFALRLPSKKIGEDPLLSNEDNYIRTQHPIYDDLVKRVACPLKDYIYID